MPMLSQQNPFFPQLAMLLTVQHVSDVLNVTLFRRLNPSSRQILGKFRDPSSDVKTIFMSSVGDAAIDLPDASVIVQALAQLNQRNLTFGPFLHKFGDVLRGF